MQEAFSLDIIHMLKEPTILEYASYMGISQPNATYKINQMIEKGYLTKVPSKEDKRASHLKVTQKFIDCYRENDLYISKTLNHIEKIFDPEEVALLENPHSRGKAMVENMRGLWRYRVGDYRIICEIFEEDILISVIKIGHRRDVYK